MAESYLKRSIGTLPDLDRWKSWIGLILCGELDLCPGDKIVPLALTSSFSKGDLLYNLNSAISWLPTYKDQPRLHRIYKTADRLDEKKVRIYLAQVIAVAHLGERFPHLVTQNTGKPEVYSKVLLKVHGETSKRRYPDEEKILAAFWENVERQKWGLYEEALDLSEEASAKSKRDPEAGRGMSLEAYGMLKNFSNSVSDLKGGNKLRVGLTMACVAMESGLLEEARGHAQLSLQHPDLSLYPDILSELKGVEKRVKILRKKAGRGSSGDQ